MVCVPARPWIALTSAVAHCWALPALGAALLYFRRNRGGAAPPPLSEAERRRLDDLLDESRG